MDSSANTAPRLSALLGRLASFGEDCDRRLAQIERRFQRINWEEPEEGSEDTADQMLEEAKGVTEGYKDLNKTLMESKSQLEGFLETSIEQIQEMSANIRQQEDWAASFGAYQPKIDIDTDFEEKIRALEEQEREERAKQLAEKREELLKESGQIKEESEKEEDDEEPNIFDAKLSRATMEKLGYKFKGNGIT